MARFVLNGMRILIYFSKKYSYFLDNHHIDTENEAAQYINQFVANSHAFVVVIGASETEQDCTPVQGSNKFHEFR